MAWPVLRVPISSDRPGPDPGPGKPQNFGCVCVRECIQKLSHPHPTCHDRVEPFVVCTLIFSSFPEILCFDSAGSLRTQPRNAQPT